MPTIRGKGKISLFRNFIRSGLVIRALSFEPFGSYLAQLAFCAYLFPLRVPSEALQPKRDFPSDALDLYQSANGKALISVRHAATGPQLGLRLAYRKNLPARCVLYRP